MHEPHTAHKTLSFSCTCHLDLTKVKCSDRHLHDCCLSSLQVLICHCFSDCMNVFTCLFVCVNVLPNSEESGTADVNYLHVSARILCNFGEMEHSNKQTRRTTWVLISCSWICKYAVCIHLYKCRLTCELMNHTVCRSMW